MKEIDADEILRDIAERARKNKISTVKLCHEARINKSSFNRWKNGTMSPAVARLNMLIGALNRLTAA